ncbi:MAG: RNA polymerase factor sigma-54 [Myxococcales bacterium]|jgi:RNA polymerase sigma-54 factor|nr:RNA polymerase factor sigma-54 [Myxococcales bacterium]
MVGIELRQQLKLQQQLIMTPQLQQAIKLLQLSRIELIDMVHAELEENPALEARADYAESRDSTAPPTLSADADEPATKATSEPSDPDVVSATREIDWDKYLENYANQPSDYAPQWQGGDDARAIGETQSAESTLTDHLRWQLQMTTLTDAEQRFLDMVIGNLDSDGYFKEPPIEELARKAGLETDEAEEALKVLQNFDPVGVASRNLRECLLCQVDALELDIDVRDVVDRHLPNLEKRNYQAIARDLEIELEDVYEVARIISHLEPKPARNFIVENNYITPDIEVQKVGDRYFVVPNDDGMPRLRISKFFKTALKEGPEAREYIQNKLRSAQWLIRSIEQRRRTIVKVTECIVEKQQDFFEKGVNYLKPMILRDVAEAVELSESTVSRVTTNKYVQTPRGIFELKYFFNSPIRRESDADIASESVKNKIKEYIDDEDPKQPYSDQRLVEMLHEKGIIIARRTVAKYREAMGILSSTKRKKFF